MSWGVCTIISGRHVRENHSIEDVLGTAYLCSPIEKAPSSSSLFFAAANRFFWGQHGAEQHCRTSVPHQSVTGRSCSETRRSWSTSAHASLLSRYFDVRIIFLNIENSKLGRSPQVFDFPRLSHPISDPPSRTSLKRLSSGLGS